jgi:hypothetical protein
MKLPVVFARASRLTNCAWLLVMLGAACAQPADTAPEERLFRVSSWKELRVVHKDLVGRLDGVVAGAFTEKVGELFADQWQLLDQYAQLSTRNKVFATDVMAALNEAVPQEQAAQIVTNARTRCPARHEALCKRLIGVLVPAGK